MNAVLSDSIDETPKESLMNLIIVLKKQAASDEIIASALCYDSSLDGDGSNKDVLNIILENYDGAAWFHYSYDKLEDGRINFTEPKMEGVIEASIFNQNSTKHWSKKCDTPWYRSVWPFLKKYFQR